MITEYGVHLAGELLPTRGDWDSTWEGTPSCTGWAIHSNAGAPAHDSTKTGKLVFEYIYHWGPQACSVLLILSTEHVHQQGSGPAQRP